MKQTSHVILFLAALACFGFTLFFLIEPAPAQDPMDPAFSPYQPLGYSTTPALLASLVADLRDPFRPRFFETAQFKGVMRQADGRQATVFLDGANRAVTLAVGQSLDGITITDIGSRTCRLIIGSTSRELSIQGK
jgi:hypothetical protein